MKKYVSIILLTLLIIVSVFFIENNRIGNIYISEINPEMDYVELYNPSSYEIKLDGYYLSDNDNLFGKEKIEDITILPHSYCLYYIHNFGISSSETIYLANSNGYTIDKVSLPESNDNSSYSFFPTENKWIYAEPSPGRENIVYDYIPEPVLSVPSGVYDNPFYLSIIADDNCSIYYTLDGSTPTKDSLLYKEPIYIYDKTPEDNVFLRINNVTSDYKDVVYINQTDKAFVIRSVCIDSNGNISKESYATYVIGLDQYKNKNVISIIADPNDLFGGDGIYVTGKEYDAWYLNGQNDEKPRENFYKSGKEWEIPAYINYLSTDNNFSQGIGLRIHGGSNRNKQLKPFTLYSRFIYGSDYYFSKNIINNYKLHSFTVLNDFTDSFLPLLISDRKIATLSDCEPISVFLDGEFLYDTFAQEKYGSQYITTHYGVDKNNVVMIKNGELFDGKNEDIKLYNALYAFFDSCDYTKDDCYELIDSKIDIQSYIDYFCANVYLCNVDLSESKNFYMWRSRENSNDIYSDCRWRFMLYDIDCIEWLTNNKISSHPETINSFKETGGFIEYPLDEMPIYSYLIKNESFKKDLIVTFMDLINYNFNYDRVNDVLSPYYIYTDNDLQTTIDSFFKNRAKYIIKYMKEEYNLSDELYTITINNPNGISLNTLTLNESFTGQYFSDYPVSIKSDNKELIGYKINGKFVDEKEVVITLTSDTIIEPVWSNND